jgi:hypothetical protein
MNPSSTMPRYTVVVHEVSTYEVEADGESDASAHVRSAVRGELVLVPASVHLERLEVRRIAEQATPPESALPGVDERRDPRDDPDDPLVRMPRIL